MRREQKGPTGERDVLEQDVKARMKMGLAAFL